jgi:tRNA(fMet)-specific endonuclease VapC
VGRLILDTTLLVSSERRGSGLAIADDDDVAIAALTLAELRVGVLLASGKRRTARAAYVDRIEQTLHVEDYTADVAKAHADLLAATRRSGRPRGAHDLIIAATAISSRRTLITSDARGFVDLPGLILKTI